MEEAKEQYSKSLRHALSSFEKAKEWHWSDLIKWLKKVEGIVSRPNKCFVPELIVLSKRLAQCLNPVLPQGLHSNTLQIYSLLLESKATHSEPIDEELIAYSAGLFPFFQYASPQNKTKLLELYQNYFLSYGQHIAFLVAGLVSSVITGLEDQGAPDTVQSIYTLFDSIARVDSSCLVSAVWMALLRSPKCRIGALIYLTKRKDLDPPDGLLATNALIAGLNDPNVIVQRMTLDLAKNQFPLSSNKITVEQKIGLLEAGLKLLKKQDFTIMRRVWEWTNFADMEEGQELSLMEILEPALRNIFDIKPKTVEAARIPLDVLKIILDQESLETVVLSRVTVTVVNYLYNTRDIKEVCEYVTHRAQEVLEGGRGRYVWKCLHGFFLRGRDADKVVNTLEVIKYTITNFPLAIADAHDLSPLLTELLRRMSETPAAALTSSLELCCYLLSKVSEKPQATGFQDFFVSLCNSKLSINQLSLGADICIALGEVGLWVQCLITASQSSDVPMALVGIEKSVKLLGIEKYQSLMREEVRIDMLSRLWAQVDSQNGPKCVELLIAFHKVSKSEFAAFLAGSLVSVDVASKVLAIRRFTIFWRTAIEKWPDQLGIIFEKGEGVFNVLDHLENESPIVRHSAREWLLDSLPRFSAVIDPVLAILMHKDVARIPNPSGRLYYAQEYDSRRVLDALRKLRSLLLSGGDDVHRHLATLPLSQRALENNTKAKVYLVLVLELTLGFVQGEVQRSHRKGFEIENQSVQSAACEVLELVLRKGDAELGYLAVGKVLDTMSHSIREKNTVMQLQLLNLLSLIFFDCAIPSAHEKCKELLMSQPFSTALLEGLHTEDAYLRIHWIDFIEKILDIVTSHLTHPHLTHYIGSLLHSICDIIQRTSVKSHLFKGLGAVVQKTLSLPDRFQKGDQAPIETQNKQSLATKTSSLFDGVMRFLGKSDKRVEESSPYFEAVSMVFKELDTILLTCLTCLKQTDATVVVTSKGTTQGNEDGKERDEGMADIAPLLQPILLQFPSQFLASFLGLWLSSMRTDQSPQQRLSGLTRLLVSLQPSPVFLLSGCCDYIRLKPAVADDNRELLLAHFLCSVLMAFPKPGTGMSALDLTASEEKDFLRVVSDIFTEFEASQRPEMALWLFDLYRLVVQRLQYRTLVEDKKLRKEFTCYFKRMVDGCIKVCLEKKEAAAFPYPPSAFALKQTECSLQEAACYVLKAGLYFIATCLYPVESTSKLMAHLEGPVSMLLKALPTKTVPMELISQLLLSLLENSREYVAKLIKKDVIEFLNSAEFFETVKTPASLEHWKQIVNAVSTYCFPKKPALISDFFENLPSGVFVSKDSEIAHRARALKAVMFLVYSSERDEYASCKEVITEQLIEFLKAYDRKLLLPVLFAFRVILVRHSRPQVEELWPRLWPHIFAELLPLFKTPASATHREKLEALKLIELLSVLGLEEFHMYQWIFFYDVMKLRLIPPSESLYQTFTPVAAAEFLREFTHEWPTGAYEGNQSVQICTKALSREAGKRRLLITQQRVSAATDLDVKAQELMEAIIISNGERCEPDWDSIDLVLKGDFLFSAED